jgi:TolA-binding protein
LLYYNEKRDQKALDLYKQVITQFPNSVEAKEALTGIKNIYVNAGDADTYLNYIKNLPEGSITASSQDTVTFEAAEQRYMRDDCAGAVANFTEYVKRYNNGAFTVNAYFYMAECAYNEKNYEKSLEGYNYVIGKPQNTFTEKSLLKASSIEYRFKNYANALEHYARLEKIAEYKSNILDARVGQMRCAMQLGKYDLAGVNAIRIITSDKIAADLQNEAHLTYGKVAFNKDSLSIAVREFSIVSQAINTENGAEAKYYLALIRYKLGKYKDCEKMTLELAKQSSSDYWVAKGYILLADAYVALKDNFQAKATLKSIIDNYEGEDLKKAAQEKLDAILLAENAYLKKDLKNNETENDSVK